MKRKLITKNRFKCLTKQRIVQLCFDDKSIDKYTPGLKMIYALDDPPLFVKLEEVDAESYNGLVL
ncbi:hypothetical protein KJ966_01230 [bacterium]|nr:hypothetical protein [bacterium]